MILHNRHKRWVIGKVSSPGVGCVDVEWVGEALCLPDRRNINLIPRRVIIAHCEKILCSLVGIFGKVESPLAVERETVGVIRIAICTLGTLRRGENLERRVHRSTVDLVEFGVVPLLEALCLERVATYDSQC